jgi:hypothetical protein
MALNVHDAVLQLTEGSCDLLIAYHHPSQPLQLNPERYEMLSLGTRAWRPMRSRMPKAEPLFRLPGRRTSGCPTWLTPRPPTWRGWST